MEAIQYADIIILIGGYGKWRYVTKMLGLAAMALRKVVVPLAAFGGQARLVWDSLASSPLRDRYKEIGLDVTELNSPWREGESEALLARMMTEAYRKRSMAFEPTRQTKGNSLGVSIATAFLLFTVMAGLWVFLLLGSLYGPYPVGLAPLFGLVVLAGGIGAGTNVSYLLWRGEAMSHALQLMSLLVGVSGGMVSFILYLVGQLVFTGEVSTELPDAAALIRSGLVASFFGLFSGLFVERGYDAIRRTSESVAAELAPKR